MSQHVTTPSAPTCPMLLAQAVGENSITCLLGRRPTCVNGPAPAVVTPMLAGNVTFAFTVGVPARLTAGVFTTLTFCVVWAPAVPAFNFSSAAQIELAATYVAMAITAARPATSLRVL